MCTLSPRSPPSELTLGRAWERLISRRLLTLRTYLTKQVDVSPVLI
jgi:hypothetical protein